VQIINFVLTNMNNISISFFLDQRRKKANGYYPVKLRVYNPVNKKARLLSLSKVIYDDKDKSLIQFTLKNGFPNQRNLDSILYAERPREDTKRLKLFFIGLEKKASEIAENLSPFSFEEFENKLYGHSPTTINLVDYYQNRIDEFERKKSFSTASNYRLSRKSLLKYSSLINKKLSFDVIRKQFLEDYESYMIDELGRSETTVSMYLRALRTIFNQAIRDGILQPDSYPFGKHKYVIPTGDKVIKSLSKSQLRLLKDGVPQSSEQVIAKDYWFFSYYAQGMNIKDIALLKHKDFKQDSIQYYRAKTKTTGKKKSRLIYVTLNDEMRDFFKKYKSKKEQVDGYVFPIISHSMTAKEQYQRIRNFTRFINQHFRSYAQYLGIDEPVSTYWARHSFTNTLINNGASIEFTSEALNHSDIKTTQNYIAGFEESRKKEMMQNLMKF
jgi:integrase/recombinase XerD